MLLFGRFDHTHARRAELLSYSPRDPIVTGAAVKSRTMLCFAPTWIKENDRRELEAIRGASAACAHEHVN